MLSCGNNQLRCGGENVVRGFDEGKILSELQGVKQANSAKVLVWRRKVTEKMVATGGFEPPTPAL